MSASAIPSSAPPGAANAAEEAAGAGPIVQSSSFELSKIIAGEVPWTELKDQSHLHSNAVVYQIQPDFYNKLQELANGYRAFRFFLSDVLHDDKFEKYGTSHTHSSDFGKKDYQFDYLVYFLKNDTKVVFGFVLVKKDLQKSKLFLFFRPINEHITVDITREFVSKNLEPFMKDFWDSILSLEQQASQFETSIPPPIEPMSHIKPNIPPELPSYQDMSVRMFSPSYDFKNGTGEAAYPVYYTTLPKGTLLFRGIQGPYQLKADLFGLRNQIKTPTDVINNAFCLSEQYNVYFYPFPFASDIIKKYDKIITYILVKDVQIAVFIKPITQISALRKIALTSCGAIQPYGCKLVGHHYDICFTKKFLLENPDITGIISINEGDTRSLIESIQHNRVHVSKFINKYISLYKDDYVTSIPEIQLYPLDGRRKTITYTLPTGTISTEANVYVPYNIIKNDSNLETYIQKLTSSEGFTNDGKTYKAQIDKTTGFFVEPTIYSGDPKNLLPAEEIDHMADSFPELRFTRATGPPIISRYGGTRRRTLRRR